MRHSPCSVIAAVAVSLLACPLLTGQAPGAGIPAHGTFSDGPDVINLGNLNVHFDISLFSKQERGSKLNYVLTYDSSIYSEYASGGFEGSPVTYSWGPSGSFNWSVGQVGLSQGVVSASFDVFDTCYYSDPDNTNVIYALYDVVYQSPDGLVHTFPGGTPYGQSTWNMCTSSGTEFDSDSGDGYHLAALADPNGGVVYITDPSGKTTTIQGGNGGLAGAPYSDANGNYNNYQYSQYPPYPYSPGATFTTSIYDTTYGPIYNNGTPTTALTLTTPINGNLASVNYTDSNGAAQTVTLHYTNMQVQTAFGAPGVDEYSTADPYQPNAPGPAFLTSIVYPDGSSYSFAYEQTPGQPGYTTGRLSSITLPTGGTISYTYSGGFNGALPDGSTAGLTRTTTDGVTTYTRSNIVAAGTWQPGVTTSPGSSTTTVQDNLGDQTVITFVEIPFIYQTPGYNFYETSRQVYAGAASGTPLLSTATCYNGQRPPCVTTPVTVPFTEIYQSESLDGAPQTATDTFYNAYGLTTETDDYNSGATSPSTKTITTYAALGNNILNRPASIVEYDSSNTQIAKTTYGYDETNICNIAPVPSLGLYGSSPAGRGNQTSISRWLHAPGVADSTITTHTCYDVTGRVVSSMDANGHVTTFTHDAATDTFVVGTQLPTPSSGVAISTAAQFDPHTGLQTSSTDENGNTTTYTYDSMRRPHTITFPNTAAGNPTTTYTYPSANQTGVNELIGNGQSTDMETLVDGYGRVIRKAVYTGQPASPWILADTCYDSLGRKSFASQPYYGGGVTGGQRCSGLGDGFGYDALGRGVSVTHPDGSVQSIAYSGGALGQIVDSWDEASTHSRRTFDGFGRLMKTLELGSTASPVSLETDYSYNALNQMLSVNQLGTTGDTPRYRSFTYDSLSRLLTSTNPETGTICYGQLSGTSCVNGYDANGNLLYKTDARGVTLSYTYDALNRLTFRTASDGSPIAAFGYDGKNEYGTPLSNSGITSNNAIGRLSLESNQANAGATYSYDAMGRIVLQNTLTPSLPSWSTVTSAQYDLAGNLTSLTYPDGRIVSQGFDGAGRLSSVGYQGWTGGQVTPSNYLTVSSYDPAGHVTGATMGNSAQMTAAYNNRLEISSLAYTQPATGSGYWSKGYAWTPNGNLSQATDYVQGTIRQFGYDSLNRLTSAQDVTTAQNAQGQVTNTSVQQNDNALQNAEQIGSAGWGAGGALLTANAVAAPDGSMSAGVMTASQNSSDSYVSDSVPDPFLYDGAAVTGSVWLRVRSGTLNTYILIINVAESQWNDPGVQPITVTTQWQQFSVSTTNGNGLSQLLLQIGGAGTVSNGQIIEIWGASLQTSTAGSTTNILPSSQQIMGSSWSINNGNVVSNSDTAPDNSYTATTLTATAGSGDTYAADYVANPAQFSNKQVTGSVYLRSTSGNQNVNLYIVDVGASGWGIVTDTQVTLTGNWQRFDITGTTQAGLTYLLLQIGGAGSLTSGNTIEIWGAQMTVGSSEGGYIATTATTTSPGGQTFTLAPSGLNEAYSYDSFGNIQQMGNFGFEQAYTPENRLWGYAYDAAGNMLNDRLTNTMTYNANEQVWTLNGTTYTYLPSGNRVSKSGANATDYVYFGGRQIARYSGGQWTDLVYGTGGLLAEVPGTPGGVPEYRMLDHLGTEIGSISAAGQVTINDYAPFGQAIGGTDSDPYKFTGKERDTESGLDYFGARYYASGMGRWTSPDWSAGPSAVPYASLANPQTLNLYGYVGNNPLSQRDADGHNFDGPSTYAGDFSNTPPDATGNSRYAVLQASAAQSVAEGIAERYNTTVIVTVTYTDADETVEEVSAQQQNGSVSTAEKYLSKSKAMRPVLKAFKSGHFHLSLINDGNDRYDPNTRTVYWDPNSALETTDGGHQTPALGLGHEMAHATGNRHMTAELSGMADPQYDTREERRVILNYENPAARQLGESTRSDHGGNPYNVASPTSIIPVPPQ